MSPTAEGLPGGRALRSAGCRRGALRRRRAHRGETNPRALTGSLFEKGDVAGESVVSPFVSEYGMVIVDEAQHVAASKVLEVLGAVRAHYVYGMTATPKRDDGLDRILFLECGPSGTRWRSPTRLRSRG